MPDRPHKPGNNPSVGRDQDGQATAREARLAAALRANLRRRKAAGQQSRTVVAPDETPAPGAPGAPDDENDT